MTGFLSRVAARAVGEAPLAQPRLPSLFESGASADTFEVVDEEVVATRPAAVSATEPEPTSPAPEATGSVEPKAAKPRDTASPGESRAVVSAARPDRRPAPLEPAAPVPGGAEPPSPSDKASPGAVEQTVASPARLASPAVTARDAVAAPAVTALPAVATPPPPALASRRAPAPAAVAAHDDSPAVRVHIGRLEVRANLHEAPRPQRRREEQQPQGLSLSDYLRGKREAG